MRTTIRPTSRTTWNAPSLTTLRTASKTTLDTTLMSKSWKVNVKDNITWGGESGVVVPFIEIKQK